MKIKLLSVIVAFILLFSIVVLGEKGLISYDNSANPELGVYDTITQMGLKVKEGKTITITDSSNQPVLKIDQSLLLKTKVTGRGVREKSSPDGPLYYAKIIEDNGKKYVTLTEPKEDGEEIISRIPLIEGTTVDIKQGTDDRINIKITNSDSTILGRKKIEKPENILKEILDVDLKNEIYFRGGNIKSISIQEDTKDKKRKVFLNERELKTELEESIINVLNLDTTQGSSVIAILKKNPESIKKLGERDYYIDLYRLSDGDRLEFADLSGPFRDEYAKVRLVRIQNHKLPNEPPHISYSGVFDESKLVETKTGEPIQAGNGFLTTKETPKEFKDIKRRLGDLGEKIKGIIKFNDPKKISKINERKKSEKEARGTPLPLYTSEERRKIDKQKAFIINEEKGTNSEKLDEILITVSEAYKTNLKDLATTEKELKDLGFWKSFSKKGKQLREQLKKQRSYVANNQIYLAALIELQGDEQIYASAPVNDEKGEIREYAGESPQQREETKVTRPIEKQLTEQEKLGIVRRIKEATDLVKRGNSDPEKVWFNYLSDINKALEFQEGTKAVLEFNEARKQPSAKPTMTIQEAGKILGTTNIENIGRLEENIFIPKNSNLHFLAAKILRQNVKFERRENDLLSTGTITKDENFKNKLKELSREADTNKDSVVNMREILDYLKEHEALLELE